MAIQPRCNLTYGYQLELATVSADLQGFNFAFLNARPRPFPPCSMILATVCPTQPRGGSSPVRGTGTAQNSEARSDERLLAGLAPTDRFYAGQGTSIRGYSQNSLGPVLPDRSPAGWRLTLVLNNELRYPDRRSRRRFPFRRLGNFWDRPSALSLRTCARERLRIRIRNLNVLLRFDRIFKIL